MAILNNSNAISSGGYDINNSLRFRASASAYLNRTPGSASNRKTWTWSAWVKKAQIQGGATSTLSLFSCTTGVNDSTFLRFGFYQDKFYVGNNSAFFLQSTPLYRDPSAWYHVVVSTDTTQGTASNRMRVYINGTEITAWGTDQRATYLTSSVDLGINQATQHSIGSSLPNVGEYFDGYMTDINFIDGQQLTPSSFGETDTDTGSWKPKAYTGTYGTNGFYLKFSDIATTSGSNAGLGKDFSGNTNYWTTNNISVTAGTTYDAMIDSPTLTSATVANYAVLNPLSNLGTAQTLSEGNLKLTNTSSTWGSKFSTIGVSSGKWYAEFTVLSTSLNMVGIISDADTTITGTDKYLGSTANSYGYFHSTGVKFNNGSSSAYGASYTTNDVIGVALDMDAGTLTFYKNNTSQGTAYSSLSGVFYIGCSVSSASSSSFAANFGQRPFSYTPPTGHKALNTFNLPTPTILQGNKYMDATLYTGNGGTLSVTNASAFKPDLVWVKTRNAATTDHCLFDSVRGVSKYINSNNTGAEATYTGFGTTAFNSNGFTVVDNTGGGYLVNGSTGSPTYVGWQWQAGQGSTSSNTNGSITSTVSVNATAGFSVVTYTGNGTAGATVGHGLGVTPAMIIVKARSAGGANYEWVVQHKSVPASQILLLSNTIAATTSATFNSQYPSSSVIYLGSNTGANQSTITYVAYCWAEIAGFSKFGSYTGNGSADGPMVWTGFTPKWILFKKTTTGTGNANWWIYDAVRNTYNVATFGLLPNSSVAEQTNSTLDILSNGFKLRNSNGEFNDSSQPFIYAAFASNPFKNSNAF
jgi:hypothetical protein